MNRLPKYDEQLVYDIYERREKLDAYMIELFKAVEHDPIEDDRLRKALVRLKKSEFIAGGWADNRFYAPRVLSVLDDYLAEYPKLVELSKEQIRAILARAGSEYGISNILIYDVVSCGQNQIGWQQRDTYEWRIKVESFDFVQLNDTSKYIIHELDDLGYGVILDEINDHNSRLKRYITFLHKAMIRPQITREYYTFSDVLKSVINTSISAQAFKKIQEFDENDINTYYRELLKVDKYRVSDQTLRGQSYTGKGSGELDLLVETIDGRPLTIIEALKLDYVDKANIVKHIDKIYGYDTLGLKENIMLVYSYVRNYAAFCDGYKAFINSDSFMYNLIDVTYIRNDDMSDIRVIESAYFRNDIRRILYHVIVNFSS